MLLIFLSAGCSFGPFSIGPAEPPLETEIPAEESDTEQQPEQDVAESEEPTATPIPTNTPIPTSTPTPAPPTPTPYFLARFSRCPPEAINDKDGQCCPHQYQLDPNGFCAYKPGIPLVEEEQPSTPRHGWVIAIFLPVVLISLVWGIIELIVVRYVQPRGIDLSTIRIKAQDGLFLNTTISLTARRTLTLAAFQMTWPRVRDFVEKPLEQKLTHEALKYPTLEDLEQDLEKITESFNNLPVVRELLDDFGVQVMRFNIETQYSPETMDAIKRKGEAAAGGTAYLAYAAAARLDPESAEARELYRVYQETISQVDAARNLGGGLTSLAQVFTPKEQRRETHDESDN
jgi:hypothetical protein